MGRDARRGGGRSGADLHQAPQGRRGDDDSIVVFDSSGKPVRTFGKEYHGAGHGIDIRKENGQEFLYLSCIQQGIVVKTTLKGEVIWTKEKPEESGKYKDAAAKYSPTNVAFAPDGGFY